MRVYVKAEVCSDESVVHNVVIADADEIIILNADSEDTARDLCERLDAAIVGFEYAKAPVHDSRGPIPIPGVASVIAQRDEITRYAKAMVDAASALYADANDRGETRDKGDDTDYPDWLAFDQAKENLRAACSRMPVPMGNYADLEDALDALAELVADFDKSVQTSDPMLVKHRALLAKHGRPA